MSPKTIAISIAAGAGLLIVGSVAWAISQAVAALIAAHATIFGLLALSSAVIGLLGGARVLLAIGAQQRAKAWQSEIVHLPNNYPIHALDVRVLAQQLAASSLDQHYEVEHVRAGVNPSLTHFHQEIHATPPAELLSQLLSTSGPAPQLAGLETAPQLIAADEWRGWMDRAPHLLIAGRTEAGKTTLATALLAERVRAGDAVLVLDPHHQPGKWGGVPTIGGGNDFEAILRTLPLLLDEMDARYSEFNQGRPTEHFQRLTILIDEVPALVEACMGVAPSGRPKVDDLRWLKFAKRLGSEARKVRLSVVLLTQSTLVQDILINSQQRDNYLRVGLGDRAAALLNEERNGQRRGALQRLLVGQAHPAAMEWRGEVHLLDTTDVPALAARPLGSAVRVWTPPALPGALRQVSAAPSSPELASPTVMSVPPTTPLPEPTVQEQILMLLDVRPWRTSTEVAADLALDVRVVRVELNTLWNRQSLDRRRAPAEKTDKYEWSLNKPLNDLMAERITLAA